MRGVVKVPAIAMSVGHPVKDTVPHVNGLRTRRVGPNGVQGDAAGCEQGMRHAVAFRRQPSRVDDFGGGVVGDVPPHRDHALAVAGRCARGAHERRFGTGCRAGHHGDHGLVFTRHGQQHQVVSVVHAVRGVEVDTGHVVERIIVSVHQHARRRGVGKDDEVRAGVHQLERVADHLHRRSHTSAVVERYQPPAGIRTRPGVRTDFTAAGVGEQRHVRGVQMREPHGIGRTAHEQGVVGDE